jgi:hypothetical protein
MFEGAEGMTMRRTGLLVGVGVVVLVAVTLVACTPGAPPPNSGPAEGSRDVPPGAAASQEVAQAALDAWLASRRPGIRTHCWNGDGLPASSSFVAEVTYGADGSLLAYKMTDDGAPPAVRHCVDQVPNLVPNALEPPGVPVTVRGTLTLP